MNNSNNSTNEEKTHSTVRQKGYMPESQDKSLELTEAGKENFHWELPDLASQSQARNQTYLKDAGTVKLRWAQTGWQEGRQ